MKLYRNWIINEGARAGEHTNERTNVRTYSHTYVRDRPYIPSTTLLCEEINRVENTILGSLDITFIRQDQKRCGNGVEVARLVEPCLHFSAFFWSSQIHLLSKDTNQVFNLSCITRRFYSIKSVKHINYKKTLICLNLLKLELHYDISLVSYSYHGQCQYVVNCLQRSFLKALF